MAPRPLLACTATTVAGLEPVTARELAALGSPGRPAGPGRVQFRATTRQLYLATLMLRTAERVLVRVATFPAERFDQLERGLDTVDWAAWVGPHQPVAVRVTSRASGLWHTGAVADRVRGRVHDRTGQPAGSPDDGPPAVLHVRITHDRVVVHVDAAGEALSRRGWRLATAKAPLRPTLAAALLLAAGWDGGRSLVDPFCGSGTIAVEAARLARGLPPTHGRDLALERWPCFEPGTWAAVRGTVAGRVRDPAPAQIVATDRDAGAVAAATGNAGRAGVEADVEVRTGVLSALEPPPGPPGWLVTNPPYGQRVRSRHDLRDLYAAVGNLVRRRFPGWGVGLLVADPALAAETHLALEERLRTRSGGLPVRFVCSAPP